MIFQKKTSTTLDNIQKKGNRIVVERILNHYFWFKIKFFLFVADHIVDNGNGKSRVILYY